MICPYMILQIIPHCLVADMAAQYMREEKHHILQKAQDTVPQCHTRCYCENLNKEGIKLLQKIKANLSNAKAKLRGTRRFSGNCDDWENLYFTGKVVESYNGRYFSGQTIVTNPLLFHDIEPKTGKGWVLTNRGEIFIVTN